MEKITLIYFVLSIFCAFFGAVYEWFSHGVFSYYMIYAFAVPLLFHHFGICTLTVGCICRGILEIYGTTNHLDRWYFIFGGVFFVLEIGSYLIR